MKNIVLVFGFFILASCQPPEDTRVENPKPRDINGKWEMLDVARFIPYALLSVDSNGNGTVIISSKSDAGAIVEFDSFESHEKSFSVVLYFIDEGDRVEPEKIEGFLRDELLCFDLSENEDESEGDVEPPICFSKYKAINKLRKQADKALKKYRKNRK